MRRLPSSLIDGMLDVSQLRDALEGGGDDLLSPLIDLASLAQGLYVHDRARVYAAAVAAFEQAGVATPGIMEELFFDTITREIAEHGKTQQDKGGQLREVRSEDPQRIEVGISGLPTRAERDSAGKHRGREGREWDLAFGHPDETPEGGRRTGSSEGGRTRVEDTGSNEGGRTRVEDADWF